MHDSYYVMTCTTTIPYISNTLKKLLLQYYLYSSYNQTKYIGKDEIMHNIFSTEDDKKVSFIVEVDSFDRLYLKERTISLPMVQTSTIKRKY